MDSIVATAKELIKHCDGYEVEIEARIRKQLVNGESSKFLIDFFFEKGIRWERTEYTERRRISRSNRKCVYRQRNNDTICKSSLAKVDINDDWCTLHVSVETPIPSMYGMLEGIEPASVVRYRGTMDGHYIDVVHDKEQEHRVEVEVCDPSNFDPEFTMCVVRRVCAVLQDSTYFVGYYDWFTVIHATKMLSCNQVSIYSGDYQKPVTMTMSTLLDISRNVCKWLVTPKADGNRAFIVIIDDRVFAVNTLKSVKLEGTTTYKHNTISILDCEYVPNKDVYYVFDMIVNNGEYLGDTVPVEDRLEMAQTCIYAMCNGLQERIKTKIYHSFDSFDALHELYKRFEDDKTFDIDGMVFVNNEKGYMQDVIKWKPINTVDLMVKHNQDGHIVLATYDDFIVDVPTSNTQMLQNSPCSVWEFSYNKEENIMTPIRPRPDKGRPNSMKIVKTNMFDAVSGSMFSGKGCYLMRKYHNRVKADMIKRANDDNAVIIDIGTGQGGDVNKWKRTKHVYCIEPSVSSTNEIVDRYKDVNNIKVINSYLRDLDQSVIKGRVNIFTAFFCMNQFEDADWDALIRLISNKGSPKCRLLIIAMTSPRSHNGECFNITMKGDDKYKISIHNTRILNIDERVVNPTTLTNMVSKCRLKLVNRSLLNEDDFMTIEERRLSSMYEMFVYKR